MVVRNVLDNCFTGIEMFVCLGFRSSGLCRSRFLKQCKSKKRR